MYCQKCGTKNIDEAVFCEKCGAKLEKPIAVNATTPNLSQEPATQQTENTAPVTPTVPRKPMSKKTKGIIIGVVALLVIATGAFLVLKNIADPKHLADDYAKAYVEHDSSKLFNALGLQKTEFVNSDSLDKMLKSNDDLHYEDITDYSIESDSSTKKSSDKETNSLHYTISFSDSSNAFDYTKNVDLVKQNSKMFLFFDKWKIKPDGYISKDFAIQVPKGCKLTLDNVEVDTKYIMDGNGDGDLAQYEIYNIPCLFAGKHNGVVSMDNFKDYQFDFTSESNNYKKSVSQTVNLDELELSDDVTNTLIDTSKTYMQGIYDAAIAKKDFSDAIPEDAIYSDSLSNLTSLYNDFVDRNVKQDTHLKSVEFKTMEGAVNWKGYSSTSSCYQVSIDISTSYKASSIVKSFWDGKKQKKDYEGEDTKSFTYQLVDGKWVLSDTSALSSCIYYSSY